MIRILDINGEAIDFAKSEKDLKDTIEKKNKLNYIKMGIDLGQVVFLDNSYHGVGKTTTIFAAAEKLALNPFNDVKIAVNNKSIASGLNRESGKDYYIYYDDLLEDGHKEVLVLIDDLDMAAYKKLKLDCKITIAAGIVNIEPKSKLDRTEYVLRMPMPMGVDATTWYVESIVGELSANKHPDLTITTNLAWRAKRYGSVSEVEKAAKETGTIACKVATDKSYIALDL